MGLAFEIYDDISLNPTLEDIFHYAFAHSGILTGKSTFIEFLFQNKWYVSCIFTGPYYRFRTFQDLYGTPFALVADCDTAMLQRIIRVPFYLILFLASGYLFPISAVLNDSFYESTTLWWRLFYMTPVFFNFRMSKYYLVMISRQKFLNFPGNFKK